MLAFALVLLCGFTASGAGNPTEYEVKAAFLFNFVKFVTWPAESLPDGAPLVIGILGPDPFGDALDAMAHAQAGVRPTQITRLSAGQDARGCHLLFIAGNDRKTLSRVLDGLKGASVLTVSEAQDFAQLGVIVNFVVEDHKVRFEINPAAAERSRLRVNAKLLSLARIVGDGGRP